MFARVTVIEGDPARFEEVRQFITNQAAPRSRELPGLQTNYWLGDPTSGRVLILGVYDSQESLRATAETVAGWREQDVPALGGRVSPSMSTRSSPSWASIIAVGDECGQQVGRAGGGALLCRGGPAGSPQPARG